MLLSDRIFIAGHNGMVGRALTQQLRKRCYSNLLLKSHQELDLTKQADVRYLFEHERPKYVFIAAAKVGGIQANSTLCGEFIYDNLMIQTNIIHEAKRAGTTRLLLLGSSCMYPKNCPQPMKEEHLLSGYLEATTQPYAIAKLAGVEMCSTYNKQYGCQFITVIASDLYGPTNNYDLETSNVLPALIRKFHEAKINKHATVELWGTGTPQRDLLYSEDLANACIHFLNLSDEEYQHLLNRTELPVINVGSSTEISIIDLAKMVQQIVGHHGEIKWDKTKPDGMLRKLLDVSQLSAIDWTCKVNLEQGISLTYKDFLQHHP